MRRDATARGGPDTGRRGGTEPAPVIRVNGQERPLPSPASVAGALAALGLRGPVAVEVNGALVRRAEHARTRVAPGDRLEVVTFVGGG